VKPSGAKGAKSPTKQAGPIKPGRGAGRGSGRGAERDDDLGGGQVEGRQAVRELLIAGRRRAYEIWIAGDIDQSDVIDDIRELARASRVPVVEVSRKKLEYTARSEAPQGVLAHAAPVPAVPIEEVLKRRPNRIPFLVAVDGVTDPGNLGALLRCCEGAGVNGVVLPRHRSVHITPTVTKTSVGAVEYMPIAVVGGLPATLTRMRELAELRNRVKGKSKTKENIDASMYLLMLSMQRLVDIPTWWGAYEKAIAEGNDQDRAVDLADQSVIDAQASGTTKDLSAIERGGPVQKLFTVFYSFMNTALNLGYGKTMTEKSKAKLSVDYLLLYVVPVIMFAALKDALTPGDSGDWDDWESILNKVLKEELAFIMGMFVGIRELGPIYDAATGKPAGYQGPAGLRPVGDAIKLAKEAGQGEMDTGLRKAIINLAGSIFGLPAAQINRSITGAEALNDGDTDNPAAILFGYQEER
jgi:tRNA G18 (ribose-2'-O)-methylase SpoU